MNVLDFRLRDTQSLAGMATRFDACTRAWAAAWGLEVTISATAVVPSWARIQEGCMPDQYRHFGDGDRAMWVGRLADLVRVVETRLFDCRPAKDGVAVPARILAEVIAADAVDALAALLAQTCGIVAQPAGGQPAPEPDAALAAPGAGAALTTLSVDAATLCLLLSPAAAATLDPRPPPRAAQPLERVSLANTLVRRPHRLDLIVGAAKVDASSLMDLRVGDVLRLDRPVGNGMDLVGLDQAPVMRAHLGVHAGRKAVTVLPLL